MTVMSSFQSTEGYDIQKSNFAHSFSGREEHNYKCENKVLVKIREPGGGGAAEVI
jgi:hypothetical protein